MNTIAIVLIAAVVVGLFSLVISPLVLAIMFPAQDEPELVEHAGEILEGLSDTQ